MLASTTPGGQLRLGGALRPGKLRRLGKHGRPLQASRTLHDHTPAVERRPDARSNEAVRHPDIRQQALDFVWSSLSDGWARHGRAWETTRHGRHARLTTMNDTRSAVDTMGSVGTLDMVGKTDPPLSVTESSSHVSLKELMEEQGQEQEEAHGEHDGAGWASASLPPNLLPYLRAVGIVELNHLRAMSMMSTLCYGMEKKVNDVSMRRLGLELVTTSIAWERCLEAEAARVEAVKEGFGFGDGMSMNYSLEDDKGNEKGNGNVNGKGGSSRSTRLDREGSYASTVVSQGGSRYQIYSSPGRSEEWRVGSRVRNGDVDRDGCDREDERGRGGAGRTKRVLTLEYSDADLDVAVVQEPISPNSRNNISFFGSRGRFREFQLEQDDARERSSGRSVGNGGGGKVEVLQSNQPCAWYVADDHPHDVRYFVIQGSDNVDHWKLNLTFDPVQFESTELGLKAHRGVYEAACTLYDVFYPLVTDYIASNPRGTVAFTGHSLGGSLGTMLMLMFFHRGVLGAANLAPVHTFGSPAVFCGGEACTGSCSVNGSDGSGTVGVLEKLGLPHDAIRNVIMHNDIVPRAFACDYSVLADFLKRIHVSFREHTCLHGKRSVMFNTIGQTLILQPHEKSSYVNGEGYHPLLPKGPQLLALKHSKSRDELLKFGPVATTTIMDDDEVDLEDEVDDGENVDDLNDIEVKRVKVKPSQRYRSVSSTEEAYWELMNEPHPLRILSNRNAYGDNGSISRYHNPSNYTRALGGVLKSRIGTEKVLDRVGVLNLHHQRGDITYRPNLDPDCRNDTCPL